MSLLYRIRRRLGDWSFYCGLRLCGMRRVDLMTVPTSNTGRSVGDVFLALASEPTLRGGRRASLLTHPLHAEIVSWFADRLDLVLTTHDAPLRAAQLGARDIHCLRPQWKDELPGINNPWRYFILNRTSPATLPLRVPPAVPRVASRSLVLFPERSDNARLDPALFAPVVAEAKRRGYGCFTNCFLNANYAVSDPIPGTEPLTQLSLAELVALGRQPETILLGTRSGLFDVLYFTSTHIGARLVVLYPDRPDWLWEARFQHETVAARHAEYYWQRGNVAEHRTRDFTERACASVFADSTAPLVSS